MEGAKQAVLIADNEQLLVASYKSVLSTFPTGVCLVVFGAGDEAVAVTISSFASISLFPAIVQFALKNNSRFLGLLLESAEFGIYILSEGQKEVASYFGRYPASRVNSATLEAAASVIHCKFEGSLTKGDHTLIFGEVESFDLSGRRSMVYYQANYGVISQAS